MNLQTSIHPKSIQRKSFRRECCSLNSAPKGKLFIAIYFMCLYSYYIFGFTKIIIWLEVIRFFVQFCYSMFFSRLVQGREHIRTTRVR